MQINQYTNTATVISENDYLDLDKYISAGIYQSNKILGSSLINQLGANFANTNLTLTGNRSHDGNSNRLTMAKFKDMTFETFIAPTLGLASLNFNGYGTLSSDLTHEFNSDNGTTLSMYGNNTSMFYGGVGIGASGSTVRRLNINAPSSVIGIYSQTSDTTSGYFNSTSHYGIEATGAYGGVFTGDFAGISCDSPTGIGGSFSSASGRAIFSSGKSYFQSVGATVTNESSAVVQINSETQGFLGPRMTTTQINAISSPVEGLMVYNTTIGHICYKDPSGWRKLSHSAM